MYIAMTAIQHLIELVPQKSIRKRLGTLIGEMTLADRERESRRQLIFFGKLLHQQSFISATDGNLSIRLNDTAIMATPTGMSKGMMEPKDLVIVDLQGTKIKGKREVSSEIYMHLTIYGERPDVSAIVHAHPCTATGFASAGIALDEPLCSEIVMTLGEVPLAPYATTGSRELSESLAPFISKHNAILMANHGAVSYGETLSEAYQRMEALEHFARIVLVTQQLGRKKVLSGAEIEKLMTARKRYVSNSRKRHY